MNFGTQLNVEYSFNKQNYLIVHIKPNILILKMGYKLYIYYINVLIINYVYDLCKLLQYLKFTRSIAYTNTFTFYL